MQRGHRVIDLSMLKFGRLRVVRFVGMRKHSSEWECECECGKLTWAASSHLRRGQTQSCGCLLVQVRLEQCELRVKHGAAREGKRTKTWTAWQSMRQRCLLKTSRSYKDYGGRGITVCDRWKSFNNFLADMGEVPKGLQLDRIDNNGNYEPSNCRWATRTEQMRHTRHNLIVTHDGQSLPLSVWAEKLGVKYHRLRHQILYNNFTIPEALDKISYLPRLIRPS